MKVLDEGTGTFEYYIKVVPTKFHYLKHREVVDTNQVTPHTRFWVLTLALRSRARTRTHIHAAALHRNDRPRCCCSYDIAYSHSEFTRKCART